MLKWEDCAAPVFHVGRISIHRPGCEHNSPVLVENWPPQISSWDQSVVSILSPCLCSCFWVVDRIKTQGESCAEDSNCKSLQLFIVHKCRVKVFWRFHDIGHRDWAIFVTAPTPFIYRGPNTKLIIDKQISTSSGSQNNAIHQPPKSLLTH